MTEYLIKPIQSNQVGCLLNESFSSSPSTMETLHVILTDSGFIWKLLMRMPERVMDLWQEIADVIYRMMMLSSFKNLSAD